MDYSDHLDDLDQSHIEANMKTLIYTVPNINCGHCVNTIRMELLEEVPGVRRVEGDLALKRVTILYDDPATQSAIESLMAEIEYPVAR